MLLSRVVLKDTSKVHGGYTISKLIVLPYSSSVIGSKTPKPLSLKTQIVKEKEKFLKSILEIKKRAILKIAFTFNTLKNF